MTKEQVNSLKVGDRVKDIIDNTLEVVSISKDRMLYELKWVHEDGSMSKGSQFYVPSHFAYCEVIGKVIYRVLLRSEGEEDQIFTEFYTEEEAEDLCREYGWKYTDENGLMWSMCYEAV